MSRFRPQTGVRIESKKCQNCVQKVSFSVRKCHFFVKIVKKSLFEQKSHFFNKKVTFWTKNDKNDTFLTPGWQKCRKRQKSRFCVGFPYGKCNFLQNPPDFWKSTQICQILDKKVTDFGHILSGIPYVNVWGNPFTNRLKNQSEKCQKWRFWHNFDKKVTFWTKKSLFEQKLTLFWQNFQKPSRFWKPAHFETHFLTESCGKWHFGNWKITFPTHFLVRFRKEMTLKMSEL